jgi:hypothetical protein
MARESAREKSIREIQVARIDLNEVVQTLKGMTDDDYNTVDASVKEVYGPDIIHVTKGLERNLELAIYKIQAGQNGPSRAHSFNEQVKIAEETPPTDMVLPDHLLPDIDSTAIEFWHNKFKEAELKLKKDSERMQTQIDNLIKSLFAAISKLS